MNKKICSLICFMLILGAFIPVASIALIEKPDEGLKKIILELDENQYRNGRPDGVGRPPAPEPDLEGEYLLLTYNGLPVKWNASMLAVGITINIDFSGSGLYDVSAISDSAEAWDTATNAELFNEVLVITDGSWDKRARDIDGRNELVFGNYKRNVIAVTMIWFDGNTGEISEFDIMFNTDFTWGDAGETDEDELGDTDIMDLQNIATHELGHGAGLGDLYDSVKNSEKTMYGYSREGETKKRTLDDGDIDGINERYET